MSFTFNKYAVLSSSAVPAPANETGTEATTTEQTNDTSGDAFAARAHEFAKREGDGMSAAINAVMIAKEDWQGGPIKVLFAMQATYGEELAGFPVPDDDYSNNPDKFKVSVTDASGKTTLKNSSFYKEFAKATREGAAIIQEQDWLKRAGNNEAIKDGIPKEILALSPVQRETRLNQLVGRLTTITGAYKKAMALGFQMLAVNDVKGVVADFIYVQDADGNDTNEVANTTKPIIVYVPTTNGKPVTKYEPYSIGSFLKLQPKKAIEKGGGFDNLKATIARNTNGGATGNNGKATEVPPIKTADTFTERFVEAFRFMDEMQSASDQKEMGKFMKLLNHKDAAELKVAVVEFRNYLDDVVDELKLNQWYADLQAKRDPLVTRKAA